MTFLGYCQLKRNSPQNASIVDQKIPQFGRLFSGRDVQAGKNQLKFGGTISKHSNWKETLDQDPAAACGAATTLESVH